MPFLLVAKPRPHVTLVTLNRLDAASLEAHMRHEGIAQLYVRNLTGNFEEMIRARGDGRAPVYLDDLRQKDQKDQKDA
jgi:hypothetical protein